MIVLGAKGFAKEVLQVLHQKDETCNLHFFDDVNDFDELMLYEKFKIITSLDEAKTFVNEDNRIVLGIGNPDVRKLLSEKFEKIGGELYSTISPFSSIGSYGTQIGEGCNIMAGTVITNDVTISRGVLINLNCTVGHDSEIGEFTELSPGVQVSGFCKIGKGCSIGTGASILPKISIGDGATVGAGAVVTKDVEPGATVVGVPAKRIK